jgi:hypothetical protein
MSDLTKDQIAASKVANLLMMVAITCRPGFKHAEWACQGLRYMMEGDALHQIGKDGLEGLRRCGIKTDYD